MLLTNHRKTLRAHAKSIYFENSATLAFATLLFVALSIGFTILGGVYGSIFTSIASEKTVLLVTLTFELIGIVFSFPLLFGYIFFCSNMAHKKDVKLSDIFEYYSGKEKLISASACFLKLLKAIIFKVILPPVFFVFLSSKLESFFISSVGYFPDYILYSFTGLFILPFILLFALCYYSFGNDIARVLLLNYTGMNTISIVYEKKKFLALRLSLIPLYLISFLTFGMLFIVFTIPYTLILYSLFFKQYTSDKSLVTLGEFDKNTIENADINQKTIVFDTNTDFEIQDNPNN